MKQYDNYYKDSGIAWLENVPNHWDIVPYKRAVIIKNGKDYKDVQVNEGGFPVIGSGGEFAKASNYLYDGEVILMGRKGTINKPLYFKGKFWSVDTMFYCIPRKAVCGKYSKTRSHTDGFQRNNAKCLDEKGISRFVPHSSI